MRINQGVAGLFHKTGIFLALLFFGAMAMTAMTATNADAPLGEGLRIGIEGGAVIYLLFAGVAWVLA